MKEIRTYIKGSLSAPTERNKGGRPRIYRHFDQDESLYYKDDDGNWRCIVDDLRARGLVIPDGDAERFLPHDYHDLLSHAAARELCKTAGVFFPKPNPDRNEKRIPPPLFVIHTPERTRPAWNRSAILRHIDATIARKNKLTREEPDA